MRLTEKTMFGDYHLIDYSEQGKNTAINKLGELEDIEQELGIDLITLFKALKNGIYIWKTNIVRKKIKAPTIEYANTTISVNVFNKIGLSPYINKTTKSKGIVSIGQGMVFGKDYGKTWALTREELETKDE